MHRLADADSAQCFCLRIRWAMLAVGNSPWHVSYRLGDTSLIEINSCGNERFLGSAFKKRQVIG
ncbi:Proteasome lid subunit RPN8/RPN11 [Pseudomonas syringae pv. actinidiae]|uniref:Proteasome lid subunit RPN8/RPN11 n=1 Tax=Pseudomonas syringae pv. actinidiae TaxID=103796 RepID=A0AAN4Q6W7_PSESF|nr:Proteasome lid subunit RPN8/RPN11 [Pseudomonas syringae pv. actinidiae]